MNEQVEWAVQENKLDKTLNYGNITIKGVFVWLRKRKDIKDLSLAERQKKTNDVYREVCISRERVMFS